MRACSPSARQRALTAFRDLACAGVSTTSGASLSDASSQELREKIEPIDAPGAEAPSHVDEQLTIAAEEHARQPSERS